MRRSSFAYCLATLTLLASTGTQANDSSFGDDNDSIRLLHQPHICMDKEALLLSEERVQVDDVFTNTSGRDLSVPVAFPMSPMDFGMADHGALTDFRLWVDGKPIATTRKLVVLLDDGSDVSKAFAATGWTVDDVAAFTESGTPPTGCTPLPARCRKAPGRDDVLPITPSRPGAFLQRCRSVRCSASCCPTRQMPGRASERSWARWSVPETPTQARPAQLTPLPAAAARCRRRRWRACRPSVPPGCDW